MRPDPLEKFIHDQRPAFEVEGPSKGLWSRIQTDLDGNDGDLEGFVKDRRAEFDSELPPSRLWDNIEADLVIAEQQQPLSALPQTEAKVRRMPALYRWSAAAAVLLLIGASFMLGRNSGYQTGQADYLALIEQVQPDFADTEAHFQSEISEKFQQVVLHNDDPQLQADLDAIDQGMEEIKLELLEVPLEEREDLVNRLIESYRIKLHILERILQHLPTDDASPANEFNHDNANSEI